MATITTQYKGDMLFETQIGRHTLTMDVPATIGGKDRGPTPPTVFVAALASCVAGGIVFFCARNNIDATGLSVDVSYDKAERSPRLMNLSVSIHLPHADCAGKEEALLRFAQHCPVHEMISDPNVIRFELAAPVAS